MSRVRGVNAVAATAQAILLDTLPSTGLSRSLEDCWYCGFPATGYDHVIPYVFTGKVPREARRGSSDAGIVVPACKRCNSILGATFTPGLEQRLDCLQKYYHHHARPALLEGSDTALEDVGPNLRSFIAQGIAEAANIQARWTHVRGRLRQMQTKRFKRPL